MSKEKSKKHKSVPFESKKERAGLFGSLLAGAFSLLKGKPKEKETEIADALWLKFQILSPKDSREMALVKWKCTWEEILSNDDAAGWKRLGEMLENVKKLEKKQIQLNDRLHDLKQEITNKINQVTDYYLMKNVNGLESDVRSMKTARLFELPNVADSIVYQLQEIERQKYEISLREEKNKIEQRLKEEEQKIQANENFFVELLQNSPPAQVVIWLRGPDQICDSFAAKFLNNVPNCQVRIWHKDRIGETDILPDQKLLLNFVEFQTNLRDEITSDQEYIHNYKLFENCLIIRLHEHNGFGFCGKFYNDEQDNYVPSTIKGVHTVLKLQYVYTDSDVRLYDSANQFARSAKKDLTLKEKAKNFYYLIDSLSQSSQERSSVLKGYLDRIELSLPKFN